MMNLLYLHCKCLQGIAGTLRGVFCNICRENPVIFTDLQNLQGKSVYITGFSLQILQKTPAESLQFPAIICSVLSIHDMIYFMVYLYIFAI